MKKMFFLLVVLVFTCTNSFGYIMVPKDSIPSFVLETAQKNNIKNPDLIFPNQEILIYLGSYVQIPVLITVQKGNNLTRIIRGVIRDMSPLERDNRNLIYELLRCQETSLPVVSSKYQEKDPTIPPKEVWWSIIGLIILALIIAVILDRLKEYK